MKKKLLAALAWVFLAGVAIVFPLSSAHAVVVFKAESEVRIYDSAKTCPGYLMQNTSGGGGGMNDNSTVYMLDPLGRMVHSWNCGSVGRLTEDGYCSSQGRLMTWEGTILWTLNALPTVTTSFGSTPQATHHDGRRIWNNKIKQYTYLFVGNHTASVAELQAAGRGAQGSSITSQDGYNELNEDAQTIWYWMYSDHTYQTNNPAYPRYLDPTAPGFHIKASKGFDVFRGTDESTGGGGVVSDWIHVNAVDYDEERDLICTSSKNISTATVLNHGATFVSATTDAAVDLPLNMAAAARNQFSADKIADPSLPDGDVYYRWGNPSFYGAGDQGSFNNDGDSQLSGQHCVGWVPFYKWSRYHGDENTNAKQRAYLNETWAQPTAADLHPGAGNLNIYDNGCYRASGFKSVTHEVNIYINSAGVDTCPDKANRAAVQACVPVPEYVAGWKPMIDGVRESRQQVFKHQAKISTSHYSSHISGTQKLANGNMLVTAGNRGHIFQVTTAGEVVWDYLTGTAKFVTSGTSHFRDYWYSTEFPGVARHLTELLAAAGTAVTRAGRAASIPVGSTPGGTGVCSANSCCPIGQPNGTAPPCDSCVPCAANCTDADFDACVCAGASCASCGTCAQPDCTAFCAANSTACGTCCAALLNYNSCLPCPGCESCGVGCSHTPTPSQCADYCATEHGFDCDTCCGVTTTCAECCTPLNCATCPTGQTCDDCCTGSNCATCCPGCDSLPAYHCNTCQEICDGCPGSVANCTNCAGTCAECPPATTPACCPGWNAALNAFDPGFCKSDCPPDNCTPDIGKVCTDPTVDCFCKSNCGTCSSCETAQPTVVVGGQCPACVPCSATPPVSQGWGVGTTSSTSGGGGGAGGGGTGGGGGGGY